jgi:PAS domain S-box-containing protein
MRRLGAYRAVLLSGGLVALALTLGLLALAWSEHSSHGERTRQHTVLMTRLLADHAARQLDAAALAAATLDELLAGGIDPKGPETQAALRQTVFNLPFLRGMALMDRRGRILSSADPAEHGWVVDLSSWGAWPASGRTRLGPLTPARGLADMALTQQDGVARGVSFQPLLRTVSTPAHGELLLVALVNIDSFVNFQTLTLNDPRMAAALIGYDGTLLGATPGVDTLPGASRSDLPAFTAFLPAREDGDWLGEGLRPGVQQVAFRVTAVWPVLVIVEFDDAAAHAQWREDSEGRLMLGALVLAATLVMTLLAARSVRAREQAQAQVALQASEQQLTLSGLSELVFRCDRDGRLRYVNPAWTAMAGGDAAQWVGRRLDDALMPGQAQRLATLLAPGLGARQRTAALSLRDAQGEGRPFDCVVTPLANPDHGFVGSAVDVSERLLARQRLQTQLAFNKLVLESSPVPVSVVGRDGRYRVVNRAWEAFNGRQRDQVIGQPVGQHLPPAERALHEPRDAEVYASGQPVRYAAQIRHADGSQRDVMIEKRALPGPQGEPDGILAVVIDVTEFREAERATREARDAAEDASRAKSEFIANVSHELRTPLQSIIGFSELGQRRADGQPRLLTMFDEIHASGQRMLALVNDLLDVSRIESSVGTLHLERADLRQPVREVMSELQALAARRHVVLQARLPAAPMTAKFDPLRIQQVLRNVLANAMRFSPEHGTVEIDADAVEGWWRLRVTDRGPGIPEAEVERIFEAFVQSSRTKDGSGGTGLGLAISRTIMQAHGGRISARNRAGGGSVFEIELPVRTGAETQSMPL